MSTDLTDLTISGLFRELSEVELAIRGCEPTFTSDGGRANLNSAIVDLTVREQAICDELAVRRKNFHYEFA